MTIKGAVVITGASTGIGRACALYLDQLGFQVFAGVRRRADADTLQQQASDRLRPIFLDVTKGDDITAAVETVSSAVGQAGLAGLVNNAGIVVAGPLEFIPVDKLRRQLAVNVTGQIAVTQAFLPLLRRGRGRVINMGSISGRVAMPFMGPYAASKFALEALTDSLRMELKPWNIQVSIIEPGAIETPIWEKSISAADRMAEAWPQQAHDLYGQALTAARQAAINRSQKGTPPIKVAQAVAHALTARRPKTRYVVGRNARLGAFLAWLLPDRWRDWLITR